MRGDYLAINSSSSPIDTEVAINEKGLADASLESVAATVCALEEHWGVNNRDINATDSRSLMKKFGMSSLDDRGNAEHFYKEHIRAVDNGLRAYTRTKLEVLENKVRTTNGGYDFNPDEDDLSLGQRLDRLKRIIQGERDILMRQMNNYILKCDYLQEPDIGIIGLPTTQDITAEEKDTTNDLQKCMLFALEELKLRGLKRYRGFVCEERDETRAWTKTKPIEEFVEILFDRFNRYEMWERFTKSGTTRQNLITHLQKCVDPQFPELKPDRHVKSFLNGLYVTYVEKDKKPLFLSYDSEEFKRLDPGVVSSQYIDQKFDNNEYESFEDIPTPWFDSIMDYQGYDQETKNNMYAFIGRQLYEVGELDQWQCVPFLKGVANTGKGKICEVTAMMYDPEDVGYLSDLTEVKFGLSAINDKFLFIAPEITSKFALGQADFQSMVSGEPVSVARKFQTAISGPWKVPGIFAGNEPPGYRDNSGSIQRRFVIFPFSKQVTAQDTNPELPKHLKTELPRIIRKCNEAYLYYVHKLQNSAKHGKMDTIRNHLSDMLRAEVKKMSVATNALRHFLVSPGVVFGEDKAIPQDKFKQMFNDHCSDNNLGKHRWTSDFYSGPFQDIDLMGISKPLRLETRPAMAWHGKQFRRMPWIVGVDIEDDEPVLNNNDC